jgi:predicted ribosome quality control (RQC) complex YloA/Tae2 family protein
MSRHRQILPGLKYILPPAQNKFNPSLITQEEFLKLLPEKNSHKILQEKIQGLGPLLTKEIVFEQEGPLEIWQSFKRQIARLEAKEFSPVIMAHEGKKFAYLWPLQHLGTSISSYPDLSSCLDNHYLNKNAVTLVDELKAPLLKVVHKALQKNQHKVQKLEQELIIAEEYDRNRHFGELLMASLSEIKKGQTTCSLYSYETKQVEKIKLEAKHSPLDNAKRYFKNYKKQKERIRWNKEQIAKTKAANNYLETLATQLEISTKETLAEIKEELVEYGLVSRKRRPKEQQSELKPARYYATDQTLIMVGHSNKQNEMLTHKIAHKTDIWLHVKEIPGAHVVLRAKNATTPAALHEAALLAMHFSRARCSSQVPVDYTLVKYVKKIPGANIGLVTYTNQKTIFINNNEQLLNRLLKTQSN